MEMELQAAGHDSLLTMEGNCCCTMLLLHGSFTKAAAAVYLDGSMDAWWLVQDKIFTDIDHGCTVLF